MAPNVNLQRRKHQRDAKRDIEKLRKELSKREKQQKKQQEKEQKRQKQRDRKRKKQQNKECLALLAKERCKRYYENNIITSSNKENPRSFEKQKRIASSKEKFPSRNKRVTRVMQSYAFNISGCLKKTASRHFFIHCIHPQHIFFD
ncbi:hypothetical protein AVEN_137716-1 [Araneus ventricosus]|uniref:Uncharacterized protein n=1 Tax=Araneus ventricosus TaxID=182803 RepID=A0A4Y2JDV1_ARAVE|nr:hypothetical protein AVEN_137716-1 [Araneus ventricosus]